MTLATHVDTSPAPSVPDAGPAVRASLKNLGFDAAPPAADTAPTPIPGATAEPLDIPPTYLHLPEAASVAVPDESSPAVPPDVLPTYLHLPESSDIPVPDASLPRGDSELLAQAPLPESHGSLRDLGVDAPPPASDGALTYVPAPVPTDVPTPVLTAVSGQPPASAGAPISVPVADVSPPSLDEPVVEEPPPYLVTPETTLGQAPSLNQRTFESGTEGLPTPDRVGAGGPEESQEDAQESVEVSLVAVPLELPEGAAQPLTPELPDGELTAEYEELSVAVRERLPPEGRDEEPASEPEEPAAEAQPEAAEAPPVALEALAVLLEELPPNRPGAMTPEPEVKAPAFVLEEPSAIGAAALATPVAPDEQEAVSDAGAEEAAVAEAAVAEAAVAGEGAYAAEAAVAEAGSEAVFDGTALGAQAEPDSGALPAVEGSSLRLLSDAPHLIALPSAEASLPVADEPPAFERVSADEAQPHAAVAVPSVVVSGEPKAPLAGETMAGGEKGLGVAPERSSPPPPAGPPALRPSLRDLGVEGPPPSLDTAPTPVPDLEPDDMFAALARQSDVRASEEGTGIEQGVLLESGAPPPAEVSSPGAPEPIAGPPPPPATDEYAVSMGPLIVDEPVAPPPAPPAREDYPPTSGPTPSAAPSTRPDEFAMTMGPMMRDEPVGPPPPPEDEYAQTMGPVVMDEPPGPPPPPQSDDALAQGPPLPRASSGTPLRRGSLQGLVGSQQAPQAPPVRPTPPVAATPSPAHLRPRSGPVLPPSGPPPPQGTMAEAPARVAGVAHGPPWESAPPAPATAATCRHCGAPVVGARVFCTTCGRQLAARGMAPVAAAPAVIFCTQCGYQSPGGVRYCMRCGAPMPGPSGMAVAAPVASPGATGRPRKARRRGPPWWAWVLLLLALVALGTVLWLRFAQDLIGMQVAPAAMRMVRLFGIVGGG